MNTYIDAQALYCKLTKYERSNTTVHIGTTVYPGSFDLEPCRLTVRFHSTDIITIEHDKGIAKSVTINFGGYPTVTTRRRMNKVLRMFNLGKVYQKDHTQYYDDGYTLPEVLDTHQPNTFER